MPGLGDLVAVVGHPGLPDGTLLEHQYTTGRVTATSLASTLAASAEGAVQAIAWEFQQGMVARASALGDEGESSPEHWEQPLGSTDVHVVVVVTAPGQTELEAALDRARPALEELPGVVPIWRQDCHALPDEKEPFGFRDGISHPAVEGSGIPGSNPLEEPLKAGEFVLGYRDEMGGFPPQPVQPGVLRPACAVPRRRS